MVESQRESLADQTIRGSIWNVFSSFIQRGGALIFTLILARVLLPEKFGLYNLVLAIALILMTFSYGGINQTFIRYMAEGIKGRRKKSKSYFKYILKLKVAVLFIVSTILVLIAYPLSVYVFKKPEIFAPLLFASLYIFVFSLEGLFTSFFFVIRKVKYVGHKEIIYQSSRILLVLALVLFVSPKPSIAQMILVLIIASILALLYSYYRIHKEAGYLFGKTEKLARGDKSRISKFMIFLTLGSISFIFFGQIDTIMLGVLILDASFIGFYKAAFVLSASIGGLLTFTNVLLPIFIQIKEKNLEQAFNKVLKYSMVLGIPAAFGLAVLGDYLLVLVYGHAYLAATLPLYVLSLLIIFGILVSLFLNLFSIKEKPSEYLPLLITVIIINIILNYVLIKYLSSYSLILGATGAAIATIFSWFLYSLGLYFLVKRKLGIRPDLTLLIKPLFASLIMAVIVYWLKINLINISIISGSLLILTGAFSYFFIMLLTGGINKEDFVVIRSAMARRRNY